MEGLAQRTHASMIVGEVHGGLEVESTWLVFFIYIFLYFEGCIRV
jgi:hypothetical protein